MSEGELNGGVISDMRWVMQVLGADGGNEWIGRVGVENAAGECWG